MMSEAIDETLDKDEAEEETEDLTNQVVTAISITRIILTLLESFYQASSIHSFSPVLSSFL